jgi:hypothetical protein
LEGGVGFMRTTKGGPHGHVHPARNFISESGRPCVFHAARKRHDAIPIDNHAIYTHCHAASTIAARAEEKKTCISNNRKRRRGKWPLAREKRTAVCTVLYLIRHADEIL